MEWWGVLSEGCADLLVATVVIAGCKYTQIHTSAQGQTFPRQLEMAHVPDGYQPQIVVRYLCATTTTASPIAT